MIQRASTGPSARAQREPAGRAQLRQLAHLSAWPVRDDRRAASRFCLCRVTFTWPATMTD